MTLKDIISKVTWPECEPVLKELYPDQYESSAEGYEEILSSLKAMTPQSSDMVLCIREVEDAEEGNWWDITGLEGGTHYSISFAPWSKWLGMELSQENQEISYAKVAIHSIWEMTWHGFDEDSIKEVADDLNDRVTEAMSKEGKSIDFGELKEMIEKGED